MTQAYPLQWPARAKRAGGRKQSAFGVKSIKDADAFVRHQIKLMGGSLPVVSTNLGLRNDGLPYANQRQPDDVGVAVYFARAGKQLVFACDRWVKIEHNLYAIGKTIEALRGIERWGSSEMMEQAFTGFEALPAPQKPQGWRDILGLAGIVTAKDIDAAYRSKVPIAHPDTGGSTDAMIALNLARDEAKASLS